jgi:hypothetical protein
LGGVAGVLLGGVAGGLLGGVVGFAGVPLPLMPLVPLVPLVPLMPLDPLMPVPLLLPLMPLPLSPEVLLEELCFLPCFFLLLFWGVVVLVPWSLLMPDAPDWLPPDMDF